MRPTMLMFRSPKEKTPEFYAPKVTNDGFLIGVKPCQPKKRKSSKIRLSGSFSKQERFLDYKYLAKVTSKKLGPGTYKDFENFKLLRKKPCPTVIHKTVVGEDSADPCYMYIGNHLVFEPEFSRSFKSNLKKRSTSAYSVNQIRRPCTRLCSTLYNQDNENEGMKRTQTAKIRIRRRHKSNQRLQESNSTINKDAILAMSEDGEAKEEEVEQRKITNEYSSQPQARIRRRKSKTRRFGNNSKSFSYVKVGKKNLPDSKKLINDEYVNNVLTTTPKIEDVESQKLAQSTELKAENRNQTIESTLKTKDVTPSKDKNKTFSSYKSTHDSSLGQLSKI